MPLLPSPTKGIAIATATATTATATPTEGQKEKRAKLPLLKPCLPAKAGGGFLTYIFQQHFPVQLPCYDF